MCRVEEDKQSEVPTKGKGKALATPVVAKDTIPGLVTFFGSITESLKLLVEESRHPNALSTSGLCYGTSEITTK